ncbi:MAG: Hsp70 family protein [Cyanobacteriota bacterium]|nr:Hsp70 family protein [Cyanobacteriota bacterium]
MTVVAIDFGTSNTVVSFLEPDTKIPKTLRFDGISRLFRLTTKTGEAIAVPTVPSLVYIKEPNHLIIGQQVRDRRLGLSQPHRLFKGFKRELVAEFQSPPRQVDGELYDAAAISQGFLREIWRHLQSRHIYPTQLVVTLPVGAFELYLNWFRDTLQRLGIEAVQWVDEATAAAAGYAVARPNSLVLAVDFGGGTLDLSLVRTAAGSLKSRQFGDRNLAMRAQVLAKSDATVGGEDIDLWLTQEYLRSRNLSRAAVGEGGWQTLLELAERVKVRLSRYESAKESWLDEETFAADEMEFSRAQLEEILENRQFLGQLRACLDEVLAIASSKGVGKNEIERVLLVGGSCLIPAVQQLIVSYFGREKVKFGKPFEAVCHGAIAISQLQGVEDYLHHSYAIRLWEPVSRSYSYFPLFQKGCSYPCKGEEPLVLQVATDGQTEICLDIGEVAEVARGEVGFDRLGRMTGNSSVESVDYRALNRQNEQVCVAHLDPPGKMGEDRVSVTFEVNAQRILLATVRDLLRDRVLIEGEAIAQLK